MCEYSCGSLADLTGRATPRVFHAIREVYKMNKILQKEFEYFLANQQELVEKYQGRYVVIKDQKILGDYPDAMSAVSDAKKSHPMGTFLVQKVEPGSEVYTQTYHSRVAFA